MIDTDFKVYIIEVNTNPCLEVSSPLLGRILPAMLDSALRFILQTSKFTKYLGLR
jgi:tubulin polyglutamylase TTLL1